MDELRETITIDKNEYDSLVADSNTLSYLADGIEMAASGISSGYIIFDYGTINNVLRLLLPYTCKRIENRFSEDNK